MAGQEISAESSLNLHVKKLLHSEVRPAQWSDSNELVVFEDPYHLVAGEIFTQKPEADVRSTQVKADEVWFTWVEG